MRILSWNLNGARTIPQYHPWNTFKHWDAILKELQADIICFQEMKSSRATIGRDIALPDSFHSFFSFPASKGGYSGVAVYTDTRTATPLKAEEGLSGVLQPKIPLSPSERISTSYPLAHELDLVPDADEQIPNDLLSLDLEGRALVLDFGLFVVINLYCPNEGSDARFSYKMNYHLMLQERVRGLFAAGREVVVVGDLNVCAAPIDHCDGHLPSNASTFWEYPARIWMRDWLAPKGPLIDVLRRFWPDRKGMFTCWNTKISARETNYGTRIDYVLVTPGLMPWIKAADIQPSIKGSDHCPVFVDLHDEITTDAGQKLVLPRAPRLAVKYWPEFQGKQMLMSNFFTKRGAEAPPNGISPLATAFDTLNAQAQPVSVEEHSAPKAPQLSSSSQPDIEPSSQSSMSPPSTQTSLKLSQESSHESLKRSRTGTSTTAGGSKPKKLKAGQLKLSSFFTKPTTTTTTLPRHQQMQAHHPAELGQPLYYTRPKPGEEERKWEDRQRDIILLVCAVHAQTPPPLCTVHQEPSKEFRVNKPGPNKGKAFYLCARPVGPGYDKGRHERLREEVDHQYKCNFFMWASDAKRAAASAAAASSGVAGAASQGKPE
ncbi:Endonuclease/exonuclease/phosphatase [Russula aff. rugulosa BPL654]|nr:Endonuclease/exonuclease/phosphatase [Russula aff. rugulosa BPL654]